MTPAEEFAAGLAGSAGSWESTQAIADLAATVAEATVCSVNPPGHDWQNGLSCRWCWTTRTAGQAIVSGLASRRGGDRESALRLLAAFRAEVLAEVAE